MLPYSLGHHLLWIVYDGFFLSAAAVSFYAKALGSEVGTESLVLETKVMVAVSPTTVVALAPIDLK